VNGGVWKTNDYGRTWTPIFDDQPTGSIGAVCRFAFRSQLRSTLAVVKDCNARSSVGDGIYKSTDAGKTWTHLGLRDGQQIPQIAIDPKDANKILVAVAGHPYGPMKSAGFTAPLMAGKSFRRVLYKDENIGGADVKIDPSNPNIAYALAVGGRQGPWGTGAWNGTGGGIYKSTDGGAPGTSLRKACPKESCKRTSRFHRASPTASRFGRNKDTVRLYQSADAGQSWTQATTDARPAGRIGRWRPLHPRFDPKNPDTIYAPAP